MDALIPLSLALLVAVSSPAERLNWQSAQQMREPAAQLAQAEKPATAISASSAETETPVVRYTILPAATKAPTKDPIVRIMQAAPTEDAKGETPAHTAEPSPEPTPEPTEAPPDIREIDKVIEGTVRKVFDGYFYMAFKGHEVHINVNSDTKIMVPFTRGTKVQITHSGKVIMNERPEMTAQIIEAAPEPEPTKKPAKK